MAFKAALSQEMAWFDRKENSTGAIISRLAEAHSIQGVRTAYRLRNQKYEDHIHIASIRCLAFGWVPSSSRVSP